MKCMQCGIDFEPKRADARFCSDKCRKASKRANADIIPDKIKSDTPKNVRDNLPDWIMLEINAVATDEQDRQIRIGRALGYQRLFPERASCGSDLAFTREYVRLR